MIKTIKLPTTYRLLNHGPTVLISSAHNGQRNIMAAAWVCALDFDPPKITVVIDKNTYTRELIEASGTFAINVPCVAQIDIVKALGSCSGRDFLALNCHCEHSEAIHRSSESGLPQRDAPRKDAIRDKCTEYNLTTFDAQKINAPLLDGCVAWLECKIIPEPHIQTSYDLFVAEVVAAYADERVFSDGRWHFEGHDQKTLDKLRTIHHVAGGAFFATGNALQAKT